MAPEIQIFSAGRSGIQHHHRRQQRLRIGIAPCAPPNRNRYEFARNDVVDLIGFLNRDSLFRAMVLRSTIHVGEIYELADAYKIPSLFQAAMNRDHRKKKNKSEENMKTVRNATGTPYEAPKHHGVYGIQKFMEESKRVKVMYSYFQPNGGAEMSGSPTEKIYYIAKGSITVNGKDESHVLNEGDLIFIGANEEREMVINDGKPAEVLVFIITP